VVLDTNIVLDWLVFDDQDVAGVRAAIMTGRACWIASPAMLDELETVLTRGALLQRQPDVPGIRTSWQRWANFVTPRSLSPAANLRCTDADDQKFIDLALQVGAQGLVTRDRALLRLARRARAHGLDILTGSAWSRKYAG
jgi:predicted nucleic acid-binding protein